LIEVNSVAEGDVKRSVSSQEVTMDADPKYAEAKQYVEAVKGFYVHLIVFVCVMSGLAALNVFLKTEWWVQWPLLGWGLGLLGHAIGVYCPVHVFGSEWEERKIKQRMAKM
jgi:2TM domain